MVVVLNVETATQSFKEHGESRTNDITHTKNHNIPPVTKANDPEIYDLPNKEFKKLFEKIQEVIKK